MTPAPADDRDPSPCSPSVVLLSRPRGAPETLALFRGDRPRRGPHNALRPAGPRICEQMRKGKARRPGSNVRVAGEGNRRRDQDAAARRKARTLGASYVFTGNLSRIGSG